MSNSLKFVIAAAAVVVVAFVGFNLLPRDTGQVGSPSSAAPSAQPTPTPTPDRTPGPTPIAKFPPEGPLPPGTYSAILEGLKVSFTVPGSGWVSWPGNGVGTATYGNANDFDFTLWEHTPDNFYSDPCAHTPLDPAPDQTTAALAAAAAAIPGTDLVSGPSSVTVGGHAAQYVAFAIRDDIGCDPQEFRIWFDASGGGEDWRWAGTLGEIHQAWIIDVDGTIVWIDAETWPGADAAVDQAVADFIGSITFE